MNSIPDNLDELAAWVAAREAQCKDLRPDNHARIVWGANGAGARTELAFVFVHGFSASPRELSPFPERLARAFGANLYLARLTGHGRDDPEAMSRVSVDAWQQDAREAFEIGCRLGRRVVLMGSSTGATLATWAATCAWSQQQLAASIWVSPNFGIADRRSMLLGLPGARRWLHWLVGAERRVSPESEAHARYWTLNYPLHAVVTMHELVQSVARLRARALNGPLLALYCEADEVVSAARTEQFLQQLPPEQWERILLPAMADGSNHVLLGDAAGDPALTDQAVEVGIRFLRQRLNWPEPSQRAAATEVALVAEMERGP